MLFASGSTAAAAGGQQSLKFNDDESQYLSWTPAAAGNRKTWTWSGWVKRGNIGTTQSLFASRVSAEDTIRFDSGSTFNFYVYSGGYVGQLNTPSVYRDPSSWYHIVCVWDTTNATSTDRMRAYINGKRLTAFNTATYPSLNADSFINGLQEHSIGQNDAGGEYFDGYLSDVYFIDGQALDASSFGQFTDGYWEAIDYAGSYGTNGFHLTFQDDVVSEGFNTVTYRGTGASQSVSGLGLEADLVWLKQRNGTGYHQLFDSIRGVTHNLASNSTDAEGTISSMLTSFDSDGFSLSTNGDVNGSGNSYVAWAWDAGGAPTADNSAAANAEPTAGSAKIDGSNKSGAFSGSPNIAVTRLSANTARGFSIVTYTGSSNTSFPHGLSSAPKWVIIKQRSGTAQWAVYHTGLSSTSHYLNLDDSGAEASYGSAFISPASNTVTIDASSSLLNANSSTYVAYCFAEVAGYSSFGSYTGNGSSTGPVVSVGFRPAFLMVKRTDDAFNWMMIDNTRSPVNPNTLRLQPNSSNAEDSNTAFHCDLTSNGFQFNTVDGQFNASGGTYIYMAFADTREAAFWKDVSGQGNHWTPNNLDYRDSLIDSPANNFATLNALFRGTSNSRTISEGNLKYQANSDDFMAGTFGVSSGKYYFEIFVNDIERSNNYFGIALDTNRSTTEAVYYRSGSGQLVDALGGSTTQTVTDAVDGDIISIAVDLDGGSVQFKLNNSDLGTAISLQNGTYVPFTGNGNTTAGSKIWTFNFGQDSTFAGATTAGGNQDDNGIGDFAYPVPSGFLSLCSASLPTPSIVDGSEHFNTVLYTGDDSTQAITGVGFGSAPDLTWIKNRAAASTHRLYNSLTYGGPVSAGSTTNYLASNSTIAETASASTLISFDSDGFTVHGSGNDTNDLGETYASWNWKAGGTAVSNTDGSITSQVSANTDAGFSIATFTGVATGVDSSFGHGLGTTPSMVIVKRRNSSDFWWVWHTDLSHPTDRYLKLNDTSAEITGSGTWGGGITSSVVGLRGSSFSTGTSDTFVAYCFANSDIIKAGSYTGNGSSDGPFVFTGGRVQWLMIKRTDSAHSWYIFDDVRTPTNPQGYNIMANSSNAEDGPTNIPLDFLSNGFKPRGTGGSQNASGGSYIYLAIMESPLKHSNAR
jgi:hypothetical protein